eukprot:TRINITY_DN94100_c0_g1_i1.p1 TRINITY_DN94100_c0_g1~~TRINITY_DN94100_c0_g1_i1.p1  ORF type:complete len:171 (+),score=24.02 TRINITY_DN94100_c0_g1_i1:60-572(+)
MSRHNLLAFAMIVFMLLSFQAMGRRTEVDKVSSMSTNTKSQPQDQHRDVGVGDLAEASRAGGGYFEVHINPLNGLATYSLDGGELQNSLSNIEGQNNRGKALLKLIPQDSSNVKDFGENLNNRENGTFLQVFIALRAIMSKAYDLSDFSASYMTEKFEVTELVVYGRYKW